MRPIFTRSTLKSALAIYIPVRVMASLAALVANDGIPANVTIAAGGYSKPVYSKVLELFFGVWERSDALWYFHIARDGYSIGSSDAVFMPLYPLLIRCVHLLTRLPWLYSGLLVSNLAFILALIGFRELVEREFGAETAERSCWYLALFPGSFFFLAPYTESLFLALAVYAFLLAKRGRWGRAAVAGFFLSLTRNLGAAIFLPLVFEFISQLRQRQVTPKKAAPLLGIALGPLALGLYFYFTTGNPVAWILHQDSWGRVFLSPWKTLAGGIRQAWDFSGGYPGAVYVLEAASTLGAVALLVFGVLGRRISASYLVFILLMLLPFLFAPYPGRMLMSSCRFVAVVFPLFILLGESVRKQSTDALVRTAFAGLYSLALALYVSNQNMF